MGALKEQTAVEKAPDAFRTISEVAEDLKLPQHVLRFWETRFPQIKPMKRGGGRRFYRPDDVDLLRGIRHLLYSEGYTIRGVQRILKDEGIRFVQTVWISGAPQPSRSPGESEAASESGPIDHLLDDPVAGEDDERERGRGLFGLLPSLLGGFTDDLAPGDRAEHRLAPPIEEIGEALPPVCPPDGDDAYFTAGNGVHGLVDTLPVLQRRPLPARGELAEGVGGVAVASGLSREDLRALQNTLVELRECRRLLDTALREATN
jgi:DNA-binding transcriptional MerR regulator